MADFRQLKLGSERLGSAQMIGSALSEEYQRLKAMMPVAVAAEELDGATLRALAKAKMDKRHAVLDDLMD